MAEDFEIKADWSQDAEDWHLLDGGYAIPERFTIHATGASGSMVDLFVEVSSGKARTRSLTVVTAAPEGVTAALVRRVPIREIVARGALNLLRRPRVAKDGTTKLAPFTLEESEEAYAVLERVVRYVEVGAAIEHDTAQPITPRGGRARRQS